MERAGSSQVEGAFGSDKRLRTEEVRPLCGMSDSLLQYGACFARWCLQCPGGVCSAPHPRRLDRTYFACRTICKGGGFDQ